MKIKIKKMYGYDVSFNGYIVDFVREAGKTIAVIVFEGGTVENCCIDDLEVDYKDFIN